MLPPDQVIEQTINKDKKGPLCIIGISTSQGSMQQWVLASHNTTTLNVDLRKSLNLDIGDSATKNLSLKEIRSNENAVKNELSNRQIYPFIEISNIFCLSSGLVLCYEIQHNVLEALKIGQLCLDTIIMRELKQATSIFMQLSR